MYMYGTELKLRDHWGVLVQLFVKYTIANIYNSRVTEVKLNGLSQIFSSVVGKINCPKSFKALLTWQDVPQQSGGARPMMQLLVADILTRF